MDQFTNHFDVITGDSNGSERTTHRPSYYPAQPDSAFVEYLVTAKAPSHILWVADDGTETILACALAAMNFPPASARGPRPTGGGFSAAGERRLQPAPRPHHEWFPPRLRLSDLSG